VGVVEAEALGLQRARRGLITPATATSTIYEAVPAASIGVTSRSRQLWLLATALLTLAAFVGAVALAPAASASPSRGLAWLLFLGSSVHVAGTGWLYTLTDVRVHARSHLPRYVWAPIGLVLGAALAALVVSPTVFGWLLLPYFGWQFFHFQKQNLGMAALAASSRGVAGLRVVERRAMMLAGIAGIAALMARPALLQLRVGSGLDDLFPVAALTFAAAVAVGVGLLALRPRRDRPPGFCLIYMVSLCFSLPVFVFASPYAAVGGMTIAHGLQYLLLVGLIAAARGTGASRVLGLAMFCNVALLGGGVLTVASHMHGGDAVERCLFGAYLGVVMAHFVIDAGIWRLREPFPRQFMASHVPYLLAPSGPVQARPVDDRSPSDI
jgi:hypothetical protein